jgi:hypothetical protein
MVSVKDVGFGLPVAFALMIEMVSAFGPLGILAYAETMHVAPRRDASGHVGTRRDLSGLSTTPDIEESRAEGLIRFIAERTEPTESRSGIGVDELFAAYRAWCKSLALPPLEAKPFAREFDKLRASPELQGTIKKFGARYFGIALAETRGPVSAAS